MAKRPTGGRTAAAGPKKVSAGKPKAKASAGTKKAAANLSPALKALTAFEASGTLKALEFTLGAHTARHVRVMLMPAPIDPGEPELVLLDDQSWPARRRPTGRRVKAQIELEGNPGDTATITIRNATTPNWPLVIPQDAPDTGWIFSRLLIVA